MTNKYCDTLRIPVPSLEQVANHREAIPFSLLITALLERGAPMTLQEVATRISQAGIQTPERVLLSLKRCKPARDPIFRDGDQYALDLHSQELALWISRLGLRPRPVPRPAPKPEPNPLPGVDVPLSAEELEEAFRDAYLTSWSHQRLAIAVLEAHGRPLLPAEVVETLSGLTRHHLMRVDGVQVHRTSPIVLSSDGQWKLVPDHAAIRSAREAVRRRLERVRRERASQPDPETLAKLRRELDAEQAASAASAASLRRVIVYAFPPEEPRAVTLLDVSNRSLETFFEEVLACARARLAGYELFAALNVRPLLKGLGMDPGDRRIQELGSTQKTRRLNRQGRLLAITTALLVQGSCGISRPFADEATLWKYLLGGERTKLRQRLEADAKSLYALYQYGRLHKALRLRWGFLDESLPAPWAFPDEPGLYSLMREVLEKGGALEVVVGIAPGWADPWSRALRCSVEDDSTGFRPCLVDGRGQVIDERQVQAARWVDG